MRLNCEKRYCGFRNPIFRVVLSAVLVTFATIHSAKAEPSDLSQNSQEGGAPLLGVGKSFRQRHKAEHIVAQTKEGDSAQGEASTGPEGPPKSPPRAELPLPGEPGRGPRPNGFGKPWERFGPGPLNLTPLNLTPEQKQKIQDIRKRTGTKARDLRKTLKEKRIKMRDAMFDPDVSEAKLREQHKEVSKLQQKAEEAMFEDFLSIRGLLTPEQKKHLPEVKPPFREPPGPGMMPHPPVKPSLDPASKNLD